ncbi:MAG: hypothetical protein COB07_03640 [Sulfurovum sp.]|nr:MAG: hypothetical protein COB07_03640 [Sulfurovum sp.]
MLPYFYPPELSLYQKQFPHDYGSAMFPYDKELDVRFVELLNMAMNRNNPLTKEELINEYGEEIYDIRMHPEKRGMASLREEKLISFFYSITEKNSIGKGKLFKEYSHIILDVLENRRQTEDLGLYFDSYFSQYIVVAPFFEWDEEDRVIFSYVYPKALSAKLDQRYTSINVENTGIRISVQKLLRYVKYGENILF